jgi:hypothetical protein
MAKKKRYNDYGTNLLYHIYFQKLYEKFRTGLTFKDVSKILYREQQRLREQNYYMFITRHTILGRWREIKLDMFKPYREHIPSRKEMLDYLNNVKKEEIIIDNKSEYII